MARTAEETASILIKIYDSEFSNAEEGQYRMLWQEMRALTGTSKLSDQLLKSINQHLLRQEYVLVPCDDFIAIYSQTDVSCCRSINSRVLERYMPDEDDMVDENDVFFDEDEFDDDEEE
jgi:hypothetical protein